MLLHVRYVAPEGAGSAGTGDLLRHTVGDPWTLSVVVGVAVGFAAFVWATTQWGLWDQYRRSLVEALSSDLHLVPWILRLSAGIALLGAGLQGHWILPHLDIPARGLVSLVFLGLGFLVLVGLAVRAACLVGLAAWLLGLATYGADLLMASEVVAALVVLVAGAAGRPSLDAYLAASLPAAPRPLRRLAELRWLLGPTDSPVPAWGSTVLRIGLGASFLSAGLLEKLLDPAPAAATAARYGLDVGPLDPLGVVAIAGATEVLLGLLLILGVATRPLAALGFLVLTVTLFALPDDPVVAHVSLWGVASAVFLLGDRHRAVHDDVPGAVPTPS